MSPSPRSHAASRLKIAIVVGSIALIGAVAPAAGAAMVGGAEPAEPATRTLDVDLTEESTDARARGRWHGRCSGIVQQWVVRARVRDGARFDDGPARVRASALSGRHRWSARVEVLTRGFER